MCCISNTKGSNWICKRATYTKANSLIGMHDFIQLNVGGNWICEMVCRKHVDFFRYNNLIIFNTFVSLPHARRWLGVYNCLVAVGSWWVLHYCCVILLGRRWGPYLPTRQKHAIVYRCDLSRIFELQLNKLLSILHVISSLRMSSLHLELSLQMFLSSCLYHHNLKHKRNLIQ